MRWKRDYFGAIRISWGWLISRFKPLAVHTELIMDDDVWKIVKKKCEGRGVYVWHIMTPVNYELYKTSFNIKLSEKRVSEIMKERYLWMKNHEAKLELHIHLSLTMKNMTYQEQDKMFKKSLDWMKKELGITPTEFVPGWWSYNQDTLELCKKYGLKMIHERDYDYTHDYHWVL
jgi:peptidoglycan/xylan/chitin deacetylase (PgdA/CDA1 family)